MARFFWKPTPIEQLPGPAAASSTLFGEPLPVTDLQLAATLAQDVARVLRQTGVGLMRASVVDIDSLVSQVAWTLTERGQISTSAAEGPLDRSFTAATTAIDQLADAPDDETLLHRLSPRRWGIAWKLDDAHVVLAEAQFYDRRDIVSDADRSLLRLICSAAMRGTSGADTAEAVDVGARLMPPAVAPDEASGKAPLRRLSQALVVLSALLAAWLALATVPELRRGVAERETQVARLRTLADKTLSHGVAGALAGGDYGEVQTTLSSFAALGYFDGAAVLNPRHRVVALAGRSDPLRIGDVPPAEAQRNAQVIELAQGAQPLGQLLVLSAPATSPLPGLPATLMPVAAAALLAAAAAAVVTLLAWRGQHRRNG
jgi:hypothetical protein